MFLASPAQRDGRRLPLRNEIRRVAVAYLNVEVASRDVNGDGEVRPRMHDRVRREFTDHIWGESLREDP